MMSGFGTGMGWGGWGMGFGWLVPLVVIGLIVWAVVAFARSRGEGLGGPGSGADRALALLKERYAGGELDVDTYRRMRKDLER